jgi:tRNA(Ile)-lysidine synthase
LIPVLEQINPDFKNSFQISQQYLLQSSLMIEDYIKLIKPNFWIEKTDNISINLRALQSISHYESILYETLKEYHFTDWSAIMELINSQSGKKVLSETHQLWKDRDQLLLIKNTEKFDSLPSTHEQNTEEINKTPKFYEAVFNLQEKKKTVKTINKNSRKPELEKIKIENSIELSNMSYHIERLKRSDSINFKKRGIEYFDAETIEFPLFIRHWQIGDFFFPLGMNGRKKLSDYFVDLKLSVLDKEKIWLLCDAKDNILWIIGYRIDNRFKVTETTKNLIKITPTP